VKIEGEYLFNGEKEAVWEVVHDPEILATALPGTKSLKEVNQNEYEGEMNIRVGPVGGLFSGKLVISNEIPPDSCTLSVDGRGGQGFANGTGNVTLIEQDDGKTLMKYDGEVQIGGKLAGVGQRMLDTASKSIIRQGLEALNSAVEARAAAKSEGRSVDYTPPSESQFVASVAKDMAGQMLSSTRIIWIILAILVILAVVAVLWFSLSSGG
jgi:carbon monoxide dehydrogenase subunit G